MQRFLAVTKQANLVPGHDVPVFYAVRRFRWLEVRVGPGIPLRPDTRERLEVHEVGRPWRRGRLLEYFSPRESLGRHDGQANSRCQE